MTDQELIRRVATEVMEFESWDSGWWILDQEKYFNPLTNANHWMMVVEKMREEGFKRFDLIVLENCTMAQFSKEFPVPFGFTGQEDNLGAGHAVCLAALKTRRGEI